MNHRKKDKLSFNKIMKINKVVKQIINIMNRKMVNKLIKENHWKATKVISKKNKMKININNYPISQKQLLKKYQAQKNSLHLIIQLQEHLII